MMQLKTLLITSTSMMPHHLVGADRPPYLGAGTHWLLCQVKKATNIIHKRLSLVYHVDSGSPRAIRTGANMGSSGNSESPPCLQQARPRRGAQASNGQRHARRHEEKQKQNVQKEGPSTLRRHLQAALKRARQVQLPQAVLDSDATSSFIRPQDGATPTGEPSRNVRVPGALKTFEALEAVEALEALEATEKALLPMTHLRDNALQSDVISGLRHNSLRGYKGRLARVSPPG